MKEAAILTAFCPENCFIDENSLIIGVDAGCEYLLAKGITPHYAVGDFDSAEPDLLSRLPLTTVVQISPSEKDKSDTELAIDLAHQLGCRKITIFNTLKGRADHAYGVIANIQYAHQLGLIAEIDTGDETVSVVENNLLIKNRKGVIVSVYSLVSLSQNITLEGFKYPLNNASLRNTECLGLSNIITSDIASISIGLGKLLVFIGK
ncbi:MAG: thiamine diphosphokinase [Candidatus Cloacimonetes bacterium]|nr:thiamine diphosphokinase [Candidatus Cloacimonadota bacterium]